MPPTGDLADNPGMCPDWESNRTLFGLQAYAQSTEQHQPGWELLFLNESGQGSARLQSQSSSQQSYICEYFLNNALFLMIFLSKFFGYNPHNDFRLLLFSFPF